MAQVELSSQLLKVKEELYESNEYGATYQKVDAKLSESHKDYLRNTYGIDKDKDLHDMCVNCQARQLIKYYGEKPKVGEVNQFAVECQGVKKHLEIGREELERLTSDDTIDQKKALRLLKATKDPVAWVSLMFGFKDEDPNWRLRNYQKEQLRCNALRNVVREGRRSGKTFVMALKMIYLAFNKTYKKGVDERTGEDITEGPEIMIVTPYQSQISNIFVEMEKILKRNPTLCEKITSGTGGSLYTKTPFFQMRFENGAKISGFVSGVGNKVDGSGGGTMRGMSASIIYLDEMDMIPEETMRSVVLPILLTKPDVMLIATSTPIGKRGKFYDWCKQNPMWKEDYLPSTVLPHWEKIKHEAENEGTADSFREEYLAEFMDGAHGVFKPSYVYAARQDYEYVNCESPRWWKNFANVKEPNKMVKVIGIDWNKNAGTEFVVVCYDPGKHHWFVAESTNITASEFNSIAWKEEVIRLNYKWKPDYIYADEGYGHTIIEDLKLLGYQIKSKQKKDARDIETAKLPERLVAFNFSSKVDLTSPVDGTQFTKTGKEYIVQNAVRIFEDQKIWFPESDEVLRKQLLAYVVLRRSPTTNKPIYGSESETVGDHRLDALMLALAGLSLEFSVYAKNSAPMSAPEFINKEVLDRRSNSKKGMSALEILQRASAPPDKNGISKFQMTQEEFLKSVSDKSHSRARDDLSNGSRMDPKKSIIQQVMQGQEAQENPSSFHRIDRRGIRRRNFGRRR